MAGRYKAYPEYQDSGIEWLGDLPKNWRVFRGKFVFNEFSERSESGDETLLSVSEYYGVKPRSGVIDEGDFLSRAESLVGYKKCYQNDLVMNIMLAWKRGLGVSKYDGIVSPAYSVFRFFDEISPEYMHYTLRTDLYVEHFKTRSTGVIDSRLRLYPDSFRNVPILTPSLPEQKHIARFLDHETGKIDALIEKQQALIALLQEKRQAVISHAVTKGLNPEARMKDSGVEWLGDVPEHWRTGKFTHYIQIRHGHQFRDYDFTGEGIKIIKITQLHRDGYLDLSSCSTVASGRDREFPDIQIRENDVLMCLTGGTIGKIIRVGEVNEPLLQNYRVGHFSHANQLLTNDYIYYLMSSDVILRQINFLLRETGQPNIGMEDFGGMKICIPCLEEQDSICSYIEESLPKFDDLISHAEMQVNLLQERRTALISAAVTGKIDVRSWTAPEEPVQKEEV